MDQVCFKERILNKNLGKKGTDVITGFSGIIVGHVEYYTGCNQYLIAPHCKRGEESTKPESHWFDDSRVKIVGKTVVQLIEDKPDGPDKAPRAI